MSGFLFVAMGGAVGSALRYGAGLAMSRFFPAMETAGTLFVNIAGSGALGLMMAWFLSLENPRTLLFLFLTTGLMGGFTTFSTFSREAVHMFTEGSAIRAFAYIGLSVAGSLGAFFVCLMAGRRLFA